MDREGLKHWYDDFSEYLETLGVQMSDLYRRGCVYVYCRDESENSEFSVRHAFMNKNADGSYVIPRPKAKDRSILEEGLNFFNYEEDFYRFGYAVDWFEKNCIAFDPQTEGGQRQIELLKEAWEDGRIVLSQYVSDSERGSMFNYRVLYRKDDKSFGVTEYMDDTSLGSARTLEAILDDPKGDNISERYEKCTGRKMPQVDRYQWTLFETPPEKAERPGLLTSVGAKLGGKNQKKQMEEYESGCEAYELYISTKDSVQEKCERIRTIIHHQNRIDMPECKDADRIMENFSRMVRDYRSRIETEEGKEIYCGDAAINLKLYVELGKQKNAAKADRLRKRLKDDVDNAYRELVSLHIDTGETNEDEIRTAKVLLARAAVGEYSMRHLKSHATGLFPERFKHLESERGREETINKMLSSKAFDRFFNTEVRPDPGAFVDRTVRDTENSGVYRRIAEYSKTARDEAGNRRRKEQPKTSFYTDDAITAVL